MSRHRPLPTLAALAWVSLAVGTALVHAPDAQAESPTHAPAPQDPAEGAVLNATSGTYSVHRVPTRSLDAVMKSLASWHHQVLADDSTADYSAEDGILSMECSACGLSRPSAIDLATVDLDSVMAYEAGTWHIGIRSKDGTQDFFGVLRGELGPGPHDPDRVSEDQRNALAALVDLYDLAYLTQNPQGPATAAATEAPNAQAITTPASSSRPAPPPTALTTHPAKPANVAPTATEAAKPAAPASLETLASSGDIEAIQARRTKANAREIARALETAYGTHARDQMLRGKVDACLQTLSAGRQTFGKSPTLRDREAHYVVVGDAWDRLRLAVKLDVPELQSYLQKIQTLEPDDATAIEQMLARTLSNRIADQKAAGRKTIVDDLLRSGRELFPAWADQLAQGTPGALPQIGVEIGSLDAPTDNLPH